MYFKIFLTIFSYSMRPRLPSQLLRLPLSLDSERRQQLAQAKRHLELRLEAR